MKRLIFMFISVMHTVAQGLVDFDNRNLVNPITGAVYQAPVTLPDGSLVRGSSFTAGLFLAQGDTLTLLVSTHFREPISQAGYFVPVFNIEVPGLPPGSPATFRARVWETAAGSYDTAIASGRYFGEFVKSSGDPNVFIPFLGMTNPPGPIPMPNMNGIQPLTLAPEPHTLALLALATVVLISTFPNREKARRVQTR